jgi:hypothetical protein
VLAAEAAREKSAGGYEYRQSVAEYREGIVFGEFVRRAVLPEIKVSEEDGRDYYRTHQADFTLPAFYGLESLAFSTPRAARAAADLYRGGTDVTWLKAHAEGLIAPEKRTLDFNGATVSAASLPDALRSQLSNAKAGDVRVFDDGGEHDAIIVRAVVVPAQRPYLEVRAEIAKKLSGEKVNRALAEWVEKLRKAHEVQVYLRQIGS